MKSARQAIIILLVVLALAVPVSGCVAFGDLLSEREQPRVSVDPIDPGWEPAYVQYEVGAHLDSDNLVAALAPTVVSIISEKTAYDRFFRAVPKRGAGSGVIIDPRGYIVTNAHVVEDAESLTVALYDGRTFEAVTWVMDTATDLAVLAIESPEELPSARFLSGSLARLRLLEEVVAVGNALALPEGPTWTSGVVSFLGRSVKVSGEVVLDDLIQTDAAINPGNSGGPLVNKAGQVVGINTAIAEDYQNIGFAISTDTAIPVINSLIRNGSVTWAWLGVTMLTVTPAIQSEHGLEVDYGALVVEVMPGGAAREAGLKPDDVIIRFGDAEIRDSSQLRAAIRSYVPGDVVAVTYLRGGRTLTTSVTLAGRPSS